MIHEVFVQEPWFSHIKSGSKTIEGRLNKGRFESMKVGDLIKFQNNSFQDGSFFRQISEIYKYKTFAEYLGKHLAQALPGIKSIEDGVAIYRAFYSEEDEKKYGILAVLTSKTT